MVINALNEYTVECYISDNNIEKDFSSYFQDSVKRLEWTERKEAQALSDFYNVDIKITTKV